MIRKYRSPEYNWNFDTETGMFFRWGKTLKDDAEFSPVGPEILDIEISTICHGVSGKPCTHCYKTNTAHGKNMSFETYKLILDKVSKNLLQVAFGIGDVDSNPDMYRIFQYTRDKNIIPNLTINGSRMTEEHFENISRLCGAVAVSCYEDKDLCYDTVYNLTKRINPNNKEIYKLDQVNIHMLLCEETYDDCFKILDDIRSDLRLKKLHTVVFLLLKPKGKRNNLTQLKSFEKFKKLIQYSREKTVKLGLDSCCVPYFIRTVEDPIKRKIDSLMVESCESSRFSSYINVDGQYWHCSFTEGEKGWKGIDVLSSEDFIRDVWYHDEVVKFREKSIRQGNFGECHVHDLSMI